MVVVLLLLLDTQPVAAPQTVFQVKGSGPLDAPFD